MRKITANIFIESKFTGVYIGLIIADGEALLVDGPLRTEAAREWTLMVEDLARPRYIALLDAHPDRVLGARGFDLPIIAHEATQATLREWSDAFKGGAHPVGAEADRLKRVTGVSKAIPELTFSESMTLLLGRETIRFSHHPTTMPGAMWVEIERGRTVFIGDAVTVAEPPYFGLADLDAWQRELGVLRDMAKDGCRLISSRDGRVDREAVNAMMRFLRRAETRLAKLEPGEGAPAAAERFARQLMDSYRLPNVRSDLVFERMRASLLDQIGLRSS